MMKIPAAGVLAKILAVGILAPATFVLAAPAQDLPASAANCAGIADDRARLACYDGLAARAKTGAAPAVSSSAPVPVTAPAAPPASKVESFGAETIRQTTPAKIAEKAAEEREEIRAKVTVVALSYSKHFTVTLDNGQIWRQIEADSDLARSLKSGNTVVISRGIFGSYNLVIEGRNTALFKVRRVE